MGQRYVHYHHGKGFFAFATDIKALWSHPDVPRVLSDERIGRMLIHDRASNEGETPFDGIHGLPGGAVMTVGSDGSTKKRRYWPTHARLRAAVRAVNESLSALRLEKHPDKTFIGKIQRGFDFLGYRFGAAVLKLAEATIGKFVEQATWLYEQGRRERGKAPLLGAYVRRWLGWATGGLDDLPRRGNGRVRAVPTLSTVARGATPPSSADH